MARYGSFQYSEAKYGTDTSIVGYAWGFVVDWNGDGYLDNDNEAVRMTGLSVTRGRTNYVQANGTGLERYKPGVMVATFDNEDGRYDPYNTSSPLYPNVLPGKLVDARFRADDGTIRTIMRGKIADIEVYRQAGRKVARITVRDGLQFLNDQAITVGIRGGQVDNIIINDILPATRWPDITYRGWPIWPGSTTQTIQQWSAWNKNALEAIHELEDAELGQFIHQRDGYGRVIPSSYTYFNTITIDETEVLRDIAIPSPWEVVRNRIIVKVYPRRYVQINDTVFELDQPAAIANGETIRLDCEFTYNGGPVIGQIAAYTVAVNTSQSGTGTDITSSCLIITDPDVGYGGHATITNNSGSDGWVVTLTIDVANASYVVNPMSVMVEDAASQAIYGIRTLVIDSPVIDKTAYAATHAAWLLENLKNPQPWPVIQLENRPDEQFGPYIYISRIHLQLPTVELDGYYRVGGVKHDWLRENGQGVRTTFWLEPYFTP